MGFRVFRVHTRRAYGLGVRDLILTLRKEGRKEGSHKEGLWCRGSRLRGVGVLGLRLVFVVRASLTAKTPKP